MTNLQITKTENGKQAVQCSQLYRALGLNKSNYARWVETYITGDKYAIEGVDYLPLTPQSGKISPNSSSLARQSEELSKQTRNRSRSIDFILTLDFAKLLAMQTRSKKGHEDRQPPARQRTRRLRRAGLTGLRPPRSACIGRPRQPCQGTHLLLPCSLLPNP